MLHTISTSMWINFKNLRFFLLQYLMLVIIFPSSYLDRHRAADRSVFHRPFYLHAVFLIYQYAGIHDSKQQLHHCH